MARGAADREPRDSNERPNEERHSHERARGKEIRDWGKERVTQHTYPRISVRVRATILGGGAVAFTYTRTSHQSYAHLAATAGEEDGVLAAKAATGTRNDRNTVTEGHRHGERDELTRLGWY